VKILLSFLLLLAGSSGLAFPEQMGSVPSGSLFADSQSLHVKLKAPFSTLLNFKNGPVFEIKKGIVPAVLSYETEKDHWINVPVQIHLKGFSSLRNCPFPKLEIQTENPAPGTLFSKVHTVDLNTHCAELGTPNLAPYFQESFYNHREIPAYQMLEILGMPAYKIRAAWIEYENTDAKSVTAFKPDTLYRAFFLEDFKEFRQRTQTKEIGDFNAPMKSLLTPQKLATLKFVSVEGAAPVMSLLDAAQTELFEMMIGNCDWRLQVPRRSRLNGEAETNLWNIKILEKDGKWFPMAQDFSLSKFVVKPYVLEEQLNAYKKSHPKIENYSKINFCPIVIVFIRLF
jgi:hypothetical protein